MDPSHPAVPYRTENFDTVYNAEVWNKNGRYGRFGGMHVAKALTGNLEEL